MTGPPHDGPLLALAAALHQGRSLAERVRLVRFRRVRSVAAAGGGDDSENGNDERTTNDESDDGGRIVGVVGKQ